MTKFNDANKKKNEKKILITGTFAQIKCLSNVFLKKNYRLTCEDEKI